MTLTSSLPIGGGVARRHLAIADDAVERRAHFRARELLARGDHARARLGAIALRGIAANLHVFDLLRGHHAGLAQRGHALELALGLFVRLFGGARRSFGSGQAVADRGLVETHEQIAALHRIAVLLEHREHHGGNFRAQVGASLGLDRTGDRWPGGQRAVAHA